MTIEQVLAALVAVLMILLAVVAYFWKERERRNERNYENLAKLIEEHSPKVLTEKVRNVENRQESMHLWKNSTLPQQLETMSGNLYETIRRVEHNVATRLDRIETKLFNGK